MMSEMIPEDTYLSRIIDAHRRADSSRSVDMDMLFEQALKSAPPRPFEGWLTCIKSSRGVGVIAEVKRKSPSKGLLDENMDIVDIARSYEAGGAVAISVLTDYEFFGGSPDDLAEVKSHAVLPVLRKDFVVSAADVMDSRIMGADAILLIVAALSRQELKEFISIARTLRMSALVEVHDLDQLDIALNSGAHIIGVNQRDLHSFEVNRDLAVKVAGVIPAGCIAVAESGITSSEDARRLADAGYDAILVGEYLVKSGDRKAAVEMLSGYRIGKRLFQGKPASVLAGRDDDTLLVR